MPDFEVFDRSVALSTTHDPLVTILKGRILSLNRASYAALGRPRAVELLFDTAKRIIGLHPVEPAERHACFVRWAQRTPNGPFLVSAMAFFRHYRIEPAESRRWQAWVEDEVLCIALDGESEAVTSNRAGHPR